jgi:hypothetical protein
MIEITRKQHEVSCPGTPLFLLSRCCKSVSTSRSSSCLKQATIAALVKASICILRLTRPVPSLADSEDQPEKTVVVVSVGCRAVIHFRVIPSERLNGDDGSFLFGTRGRKNRNGGVVCRRKPRHLGCTLSSRSSIEIVVRG